MIGSSDFYQIEFVARFDFCLFDLIKIVLFTFDWEDFPLVRVPWFLPSPLDT